MPSSQKHEIVSTGSQSTVEKFDVVLPLVHGTNGEDGTLQGLFELSGVPYVGAGVLGSAIGMDKDVAKRLMRDSGVPVVPFFMVRKHEWEAQPEAIYTHSEESFGLPFFVKPANSGSSVGVHKIKSRSDMDTAFRDAFSFDRKVLVERACIGREIECAVMGNEQPKVSVLGEIVPSHEFYDYEAKYVDEKGAELLIPAKLSSETTNYISSMAVKAYRALECEGMARIDFFVTKDSPAGVFLNEVNTIPGFTPISMFPRLWEASGVTYAELLEELIALAFQRHAEKDRLRLDYSVK